MKVLLLFFSSLSVLFQIFILLFENCCHRGTFYYHYKYIIRILLLTIWFHLSSNEILYLTVTKLFYASVSKVRIYNTLFNSVYPIFTFEHWQYNLGIAHKYTQLETDNFWNVVKDLSCYTMTLKKPYKTFGIWETNIFQGLFDFQTL